MRWTNLGSVLPAANRDIIVRSVAPRLSVSFASDANVAGALAGKISSDAVFLRRFFGCESGLQVNRAGIAGRWDLADLVLPASLRLLRGIALRIQGLRARCCFLLITSFATPGKTISKDRLVELHMLTCLCFFHLVFRLRG